MTKKRHSTAAKLILLPLSKIYGMVTTVRNWLFDWGVIKQREFDVPVVSVGNISVGGTGKTPHTEYLIEALRSEYKIAVLSRGYKRATHGFVLATDHSTPRDIGDEAYQVYQKFGGNITVAVCEKRVEGIERLMQIDSGISLIILDDAFQHRYVKPLVSILLTEYRRPFFDDDILPYGRLRESTKAVSRADIVVVTKCPAAVTPLDFRLFEKTLNLIPAQGLFFSRFCYEPLRPVFPEGDRDVPRIDKLSGNDRILAVCGIGNPRPFVRYLKSFKPRVRVNVFADHHEFTRKDMALLLSRFNGMNGVQRVIVTTEKDAVRMVNNPYFPQELKSHIYYLPVRVDFMRETAVSFGDMVMRMISERKNNY